MVKNQTTIRFVRDVKFQEFLYQLSGLPFAASYDDEAEDALFSENISLDHFKTFVQKSFEDPCSNEVQLFQDWEVCGFGCATNTIVLQILDAYFRGQT